MLHLVLFLVGTLGLWLFVLKLLLNFVVKTVSLNLDKEEENVGTLESETFQACFHVRVIPMKLFFSIREFQIQKISTSTENIYLVKTSEK